MNGARTTFMRRGYLLTALAAAVLLAASPGTAEAQRVSIGYDAASGMVSEKAFLDTNSLEAPPTATVRVQGLQSGSRRTTDINNSLGNVSITPSKPVYIARVTPLGFSGTQLVGPTGTSDAAGNAVAVQAFVLDVDDTTGASPSTRYFDHSDEVTLVFAQSADGTPDGNWLEETIELKLSIAGSASVGTDVFTLTAKESHVAPVARFGQPDFTLSEQSTRVVSADIASGIRGVPLPTAGAANNFAGVATAFPDNLSVRVSNHGLVTFTGCPGRTDPLYNRKLFNISLDGDAATNAGADWTNANFTNTGVLTSVATIQQLAEGAATVETGSADLLIEGCGDGAGISDPYITLTVMNDGLSGLNPSFVPTYGAIKAGAPLMVSIDSDEAAPTLSFSPTDVEIDEGGETSTVLLAEGMNADQVGMVKLMVEGAAMVDLYQDGEMLQEMGGYVTVDLDGNSSARLTAMSTSDPDLMDGETKYKAWKLMDDSAQGVNIGDGYWFRVDVMGSTAVPALPLVGQLLLALFLMAGGSRLYRRRQG